MASHVDSISHKLKEVGAVNNTIKVIGGNQFLTRYKMQHYNSVIGLHCLIFFHFKWGTSIDNKFAG